MVGLNYEDAAYTIRNDLVEAQNRAWNRLSHTGTWLTGLERVKVMEETRGASNCPTCVEVKQAISPFMVRNPHVAVTDLPQSWVDMIHLIVADPGRLTHGWYKRTLNSGLDDTHFVEIVSVIAHTIAIDTFAKGIGVSIRALPDPEPGEPTKYRPKEARQHIAWAPNIAWDEFGPNEADYFVGPEASIRRALTLVPDEARNFFDLVAAQYLAGNQMRDFSREFRAISHLQIELLAARVSALNQCTY